MKKLFVLAGAVLAALAINADVRVDLSTYKKAAIESANQTSTPSYKDGVVTVEYSMTADEENWGSSGVEFDLDHLTGVTAIQFFKTGGNTGEGDDEKWVSLQVYLEDEGGARWYDPAADLAISTWKMAEEQVSVTPNELMWTEATWAFGDKPFVKVGFIANAGVVVSSSFAIRNVVIRCPQTDLNDHVLDAAPVSRMIKNGRFMINNNGKYINALGF